MCGGRDGGASEDNERRVAERVGQDGKDWMVEASVRGDGQQLETGQPDGRRGKEARGEDVS